MGLFKILDIDKNKREWPMDKTNNTHKNYTKPLFSWGNQFGASNLIIYEKNYFEKWNKNLIISSLAKKQLTRMVYDYENKSIIYIENIPIDKRIRDIISLDNGIIALLTDRGVNIEDKPEIILITKSDE